MNSPATATESSIDQVVIPATRMATPLAVVPVEAHPIQRAEPLQFDEEARRMLREMYGNEATELEFSVFLRIASPRRLDPFTRQIHFVPRNDMTGKRVWAVQVGIDGLRVIAERTGLADGQDEPEFVYDDKDASKIVLARVRVWKKGVARPYVGVAHFAEYAQYKSGGGLTKMWNEKPHIMLGKCGEALGLRKAFPEDMSGLYVPEEMPGEMDGEIIKGKREPAAPKAATATPRQPVEATAGMRKAYRRILAEIGAVETGDDLELRLAGWNKAAKEAKIPMVPWKNQIAEAIRDKREELAEVAPDDGGDDGSD